VSGGALLCPPKLLGKDGAKSERVEGYELVGADMYFIPRNNVFYHYIAHTNIWRRYCATLFLLVACTGVYVYGLYVPLSAHIVLYKTETARLQKQYEDIQQLRISGKELSTIIGQKNDMIHRYIVSDDDRQSECGKRMQFVFDSIAQLGITLHSYGSCKEKDKQWYTKDVAHSEMNGSLEQLLSFLKIIQDSTQMISLSRISLSRMKDNVFQLRCDVAIVSVKK
jgi:hypothetical protein